MAFLGSTRDDNMALLPTLDRSIYDGNIAMLAEQHNFQLYRADKNWMTELSSWQIGLSTDMQEILWVRTTFVIYSPEFG